MDEAAHHEKKPRPHAVLVPFPQQGHINPMFKVAKLLHGRGFYITFVNTEFCHRRLLSSQGANELERLPGFKFATISSTDFDIIQSKNHEKMASDIKTKFLAPFNALVKELNDFDPKVVPPVTCMISDPMMIFSVDVAKEIDIPILLLFVFGASSVLTFPHIPKLIDDGILPLKGGIFHIQKINLRDNWIGTKREMAIIVLPNCLLIGSCLSMYKEYTMKSLFFCFKIDNPKDEKGYLDTVINGIPGMDGIRLKDFPTFFQVKDLNYGPFLYFMEMLEKSRDKNFASGIIVNTFEELESRAVEELSSIFPTLFTIGPLHQLDDQIPNDQLGSFAPNLVREDLSCLAWLDSKPPNSVLLVSFGTTGFLKPEQLEEFAWGLANSKATFLWVIRSELVLGGAANFSSEFKSEIKDRALLINWCPQEKVLRHPAIGGYLTHCGWNSVLESVSAGVPLLCWPNYADQTMNSWLSCNQLGVGMEIGNDVRRDEVERLVRELISGQNGKELREKTLQWKKKAEEACHPTGSSFRNLDKMVELLVSGVR